MRLLIPAVLAAAIAVAAPVYALTVHLFPNKSSAERHCPGDTVIYVNLTSHVYHFPGTKNYGKLKNGKYGCLKEVARDPEFKPAANGQ